VHKIFTLFKPAYYLAKSSHAVTYDEPTVEYIGFAGHATNDCFEAMKSRVSGDAKKKELKINLMRAFYKTESLKKAQEVEEMLIQYSKENHSEINKNDRAGGAGRKGKNDKYFFVYGAYHVNSKD